MLKYKISLLFFVGLLYISCKSYDHLAKVSASSMKLNPGPVDSQMYQLIYPYKIEFDAKMDEVLATNPEKLSKGRPESTLTNWVADALYHQASKAFSVPIAFAYQNYGGIRVTTLGEGPVTLNKIYEIMPFDNTVVVLKLNGQELYQFFEYMAVAGGSPVSYTTRYSIEKGKPVDITIHNKPLDLAGTYYVAVPDYIANGGDNLVYLKEKPRIDNNLLVRDLLIKESKEQGILKNVLDQRVKIKN